MTGAQAQVNEAVMTMRSLLDQIESGEVSEEMSVKLDASNQKLQSLLIKRQSCVMKES